MVMISRLKPHKISQNVFVSCRFLSDAFVFKGVTTTHVKNASFAITNGSKVCLFGSNENGYCIILIIL